MDYEYGIGVDSSKYENGFMGAICVYKKKEGFKYLKTFDDEEKYEAEIERVALYYHIPKDKVFTEKD